MGKLTITGVFSIAMLVYQRVSAHFTHLLGMSEDVWGVPLKKGSQNILPLETSL